jgi:MoaA/NifB/PqqE/SkfB family radical SAM enzyme
MRQRLHVKVSRSCNNNCLFCLDDRDRREDVTEAGVAELLAAHVHLREVLFTCGEPSLHPQLPGFVAAARRAGYTSIGLVTNGRRLSYEAYCRSLIEAGLTEVTISIHGATARQHDALTRTRGSFEQTLGGLRNVHRLGQSRWIRLISSTVVTRRNAGTLADLLALLAAEGVDVMVINVVEPSGSALEHFDAVFTSYRELAASVAAALDGFEHRRRVVVEGLPLCTSLPLLDAAGVREEIHLREGDQLRALPPDRGHLKPEICGGCRLWDRCPGIYESYARRRGTDELQRQ